MKLLLKECTVIVITMNIQTKIAEIKNKLMNYPAASSGVSQRTEIVDAASGGELDWSPVSGDPSELCQKPRESHFYSLRSI
jgi:hypothetical protein